MMGLTAQWNPSLCSTLQERKLVKGKGGEEDNGQIHLGEVSASTLFFFQG